MSEAGRATLQTREWIARWSWAAAVFLVALGARLYLIHRFGTSLPVWDQWEEARVVYIPFFEGKLSLADIFSAHNEHRIVFTRLYGLGLLLLNGQWDGRLQMVVNTIIHCATVVGLGCLMTRWIGRQYWALVWLPSLLVLALPFGWENSLAGFQSQFYFLLLFSLLTLWLLGLHPAGSARWWCGVATAGMALFTVASGFLAAAAVFGLAVFRALRQPARWRKEALTIGLCTIVIVAGLILKADVRHHHLLQAHSVGDFLVSFGDNLAWPWIVIPPFAFLNLLPLAVLAWRYFRSQSDRPAEEMTLVIGLWTILQGAAAAYARGAEGRPPGWRYMDSSSFILIANCFAIAILQSRYFATRPDAASEKSSASTDGDRAREEARPPGADSASDLDWVLSRLPVFSWAARSLSKVLLMIFVLWAIAAAVGLFLLSSRAWRIDIPERALDYRAQLQLTRAFMATDDIHVFDGKPKTELPSYQGDPLAPPLKYEAEWTVNYLRNPLVRQILPACARLPLEVKVNPEPTQGFVPRGYRLKRREPATELSWGSCTTQGPAATGTFVSLPVPKSRLPYLEIPVAGNLGENDLSFELADVTNNRRTPVKPPAFAGPSWVNCYVRAPADAFTLVAQDNSKTGWFAFKAPREVGWLSFWAVQAASGWVYVLSAGVATMICLALAGRAKR